MNEYKITVAQFLTKSNPRYLDKKAVPLRVMFGIITQKTNKGVYVKMKAKMEPSTFCINCNKVLKHPVSLLYGIGPECGKHFHENPTSEKDLEKWYEGLKSHMKDIFWEGWLPLNYVSLEETGNILDETGFYFPENNFQKTENTVTELDTIKQEVMFGDEDILQMSLEITNNF